MSGWGDLVWRSGRRCWLLGLACAALVAAVGCGGADPREARDTLVFAAPADATVLDPHNTTDSQSDQVILMLFDTLIAFDVEMHIVGSLAETWEVAEDEVTWTFHLRRGVTFHDGSAFDAEAVRANFERVLDPEQNHKRLPLFEMIDRVEVVDDRSTSSPPIRSVRSSPPWRTCRVQRTQCGHNPDPYDPTPVDQGISVYYTAFKYGSISFALLEDRKFKTAPIQGADLDVHESELLGPRQEAFLEAWGRDNDGVDGRICLT